MRVPAIATLQRAHGRGTQASSLGQLLLREARALAQLPQPVSEL
jgi:hypothetical protein